MNDNWKDALCALVWALIALAISLSIDWGQ
jgi:hypothetical protein